MVGKVMKKEMTEDLWISREVIKFLRIYIDYMWKR